MRALLVDATSYTCVLPSELQQHKRLFFQIEHQVRRARLGALPLRGMGCYSAGLLELAATLRACGMFVEYTNLTDARRSLEALCPATGPDVVGFGAVCATVPACAQVAAQMKARRPQVRAVLGGAHAAAAPQLTRERFPIFDAVEPRGGAAAASLLAGRPVRIRPVPRIAYDVLRYPLHDYGINVITASGCPFSCAYCQDWRQSGESHPLDGGITTLIGQLPPGTPVHFCDSVLGGGGRRALAVCDALQRVDHGFSLSCDLRPELVTTRLVQALTAAGFVELRIGLDSAASTVLRSLSRRVSETRFISALRTVRDTSNLYVSVYLVTGLPGSTPATLEANTDMIDRLLGSGLADQLKHHLYTPYPTDQRPPELAPVTIVDHDWSHYDRNSYPVYALPGASPDLIWRDFLETEAAINRAWSRAAGLDPQHIVNGPLFSDYNAAVYLGVPGSAGAT